MRRLHLVVLMAFALGGPVSGQTPGSPAPAPAPVPAQAPTPNYFTIVGDEKNPAVDTVQFDPTPLAVAGARRQFNMRANRAAPRLSAGGVMFRSYSGVVEIDCEAKSARFVRSAFFMTPLWQGEPYRTTEYGASQERPMRLFEFTPNPTEKIIKAACPG